jgi:type I restriction enzyme M protein
VRGNTLSNPGLLENDELKTFNIVLANPPYSIKAWDQKAWTNDAFGRNIWGTPSQGCADYAFQQHIHKSLDNQNGRCVVLWPHGILFRDAEAEMRKKMIKSDVVDCIIGLGPNLFYNSPMEACLLICHTNKPKQRKGKVLFINAVEEVKTEKTISYLDESNIQKIKKVYSDYSNIDGFAKIVTNEEILINKGSLNMAQYVSNVRNLVKSELSLTEMIDTWQLGSKDLRKSISALIKELKDNNESVRYTGY